MRKSIMLAVLPALALAGCQTPTGPVEVTRFNRAGEGLAYGQGSFAVALKPQGLEAATDASPKPTLAMSPYLVAVEQAMQRVGYGPLLTEKALYIAEVAVTREERLASGRSPVSVGVGGSTGGYRSGVGLGVGINLGGGAKPRIVTQLSVAIKRADTGEYVWEGRAQQEAGASNPASQPGIAAKALADALFAGFPGTNGETITVE